MKTTANWFFLVFMAPFAMGLSAQEGDAAMSALQEISNYRQYSPMFASAGQPTAEQIETLQQQGFERVIYIAFTTNPNALANEDQIVKGLGMDYLQIPVDWENPTTRDFYAFADAMQREPDMKTLLHCQINARATAFAFLYRVIFEDVPVAEAKADMNTVWKPNEKWRELIFTVLDEQAISPECEGCDWSV